MGFGLLAMGGFLLSYILNLTPIAYILSESPITLILGGRWAILIFSAILKPLEGVLGLQIVIKITSFWN